MTEPTREEIDLVLKAYSKEELARKHCILVNDVLRLEAELKAKGRTEMSLPSAKSKIEWISVDERLPEDNERVLCFDPTLAESNLGAVSVQFGWCCKRRNLSVTHWMPLPEPPKQKGE